MRLRFDPGDDGAYHAARDKLLGELDGWLDRPEEERAATVADVGSFLDWRYRESSRVLDEFAPAELAEFLLEWCPRRLKGRPDDAVHLCFAVGVYLDFMGSTGRLIGGRDRAVRLTRMVDDLAPTVLAEARGDDTDAPEPYELPFVHIPPPRAEVEAAAATAPFLTKLDDLRDYLGPDGKELTDNGNLEWADGRALVELLDTGDMIDLQLDDSTLRLQSARPLRRLNFIVDLAIEAGAVAVCERRLVRAPEWETLPPIGRAEALFAAILDVGPVGAHCSGHLLYSDQPLHLFDDGIVHWLAPLLAHDAAEQPFASVVEWAELMLSPHLERYGPEEADAVDDFTEEGIACILEVLEDAGVVRWTDRVESPQPFRPGYWTGGTVALTALGRHLLPDHLEPAGYVLRRANPVGDGDGAALIDALLSLPESEHEGLVTGWRADRPAAERVQMLTEAIAASSSAAGRMVGFTALDMFDIEVVEPLVRQLLDTPVAGHAALWLVARDPADAATLGSFVDIGVLVDVLSADVDDPVALCALFTGMSEPLELLEDMWRHPAPETAIVLEALGRHLTDSKLAKAARKAGVRHRSWMANRLG